jgi:hypothetical protein
MPHFFVYNVAEIEAHFVLECPLYNPIRDKFQSLFEKAILACLKNFFQLDHHEDISLHIIVATALHHSRELVGLTPPWCIFSP